MPRGGQILIVAGTALLLRLITLFLFADVTSPNDLEYGRIARNLLAGYGYSYSYPAHYVEGYPEGLEPGDPGYLEELEARGSAPRPTAFMLPGYTLLLTLLLSVFGNSAHLVLYLFQIMCGVLTSVLVFLIVERFAERRAAFVSGLAVALLPTFTGITFVIVPTTVELLVGAAVIYLTLRLVDEPERWINWIVLGAVLGAGVLVRQVILAYGVILILVAVGIFKKRQQSGAGTRIPLRLLTTALTAAVFIIPWSVRNFVVFDEFVPLTTKLGYNLYRGYNEEADGLERGVKNLIVKNGLLDAWKREGETAFDRRLASEAAGFIAENPGRAALLTIKRLLLGLVLDPVDNLKASGSTVFIQTATRFYEVLLLIAAIFGAVAIRSTDHTVKIILYGYLAAHLLTIMLTFVSTRFRCPVELVYSILAGPGLLWIYRRLTPLASKANS
jgi:hypothetical protein